MTTSNHHLRPLLIAIGAALVLLALSGCWLSNTHESPAAATLPTKIVSAPPDVAATATIALDATASALPPTNGTSAEEPADQPSASPAPMGVLYSDENGVFWAHPTSGEVVPLAAGAISSGWALSGARLAIVRGRSVELVDLSTGKVEMLDTGATTDLVDAQVFWGADGEHLLYAGWAEPDPEAEEPVQQLLLCELTPHGALAAPVAYTGPAAMVLGYDGAAHRALLWAPGVDGTGLQVLTVDPATGQPESTVQFAGVGELALGPGGALTWLAEQEGGYQLLTATLATTASPQALTLEAGTFVAQPTWSPDGRFVAYLLRRGALYEPTAESLGLYVLDVATGQASGPLTEALPDTRISGWAVSNDAVVLRNQSSEALYYTSVSLSGEQALLPVKGSATLLGWLLRPSLASDTPSLDAWRTRFIDAAGDAQATATAAAAFVVGNPNLSLDERSAQLRAYLAQAGWADQDWPITEIEPGLYLLTTPPASLVLAAEGTSLVIGQGSTLVDVRAEQDRVAAIYRTAVGDNTQWAVALLEKREDAWQIAWQPAGHSDWVTTNGSVAFAGRGIDRLQVTGTSLGLPADPFFECSTCPLRQLSATWELEGSAYVRRSSLPADASLSAIYWELTEPSPYALVYEVVRRWRAGEALDELCSAQAEEQLAALELGAADLRLMASSVTADTVVFGPADAPDSLQATISKGQIASFARR
ncbi:MAG: hypothetical protein ABFD20_12780 [Anaerolineales bacterium]